MVALFFQVQSPQVDSVLPWSPCRTELRSSHFSFNSIPRLGLTLAAFSELTREVFLPDQSVRIVGALSKLGKRILSATLRIFVQDCAKVLVLAAAHNLSYRTSG